MPLFDAPNSLQADPPEARETPQITAPAHDRSRRRRELWIAVALCFGLTIGLNLLGFAVPLVRANLVALFAFVFLYVPRWVSPDGAEPGAFGLSWREARRGLGWGVALSFVTFALFVPLNHLWTTSVEGTSLRPMGSNYARLPDRYQGAPADAHDGRLHVFQVGGVVHLALDPGRAPVRVQVETDGVLATPTGDEIGPSARVASRGGRPLYASYRLIGSDWIDVQAEVEGEAAPVAVGAGALAPPARDVRDGGVRARLGVAWLPLALLVQLLLIALPEEFFYRGYLLSRWPSDRAWQLGPIRLTWANVAVSAIFALGHVVIVPHPGRLAVFFPSLVFGWLYERTGGLGAPVVYHAACNLMVQVVMVHYW